MAHDHGEKIHYCEPCGYWAVATGRFSTTLCKKCNVKLIIYASREYLISNINRLYEAIPIDKTKSFGDSGFVK